jgi:hypothetical protein
MGGFEKKRRSENFFAQHAHLSQHEQAFQNSRKKILAQTGKSI